MCSRLPRAEHPVARYFFDIHDGALHQFDETGSEFDTLAEVRE